MPLCLRNAADPATLLTHHLCKDGYSGLDHEVSPPADFVTYQPSVLASGQFKFSGCHVSSCGHFMHTDCYEKFESMYIQGRPGRRQFFLCPLCKSFGDILIPVVSTQLKRLESPLSATDNDDQGVFERGHSDNMQDFDVWLQALPTTFLETESSRDKDLKAERDRSNSGVFSVSGMKSFLSKLASSPPSTSPVSMSTSMSLSLSPPRGISFLSSSPPFSRLSSEDHPMDTEVQTEGASSSAIPLSHRTSVKRPRSPSPTLSSANAAILSKITFKLEQAFSPLQKSKGQNLVYLLDSYTYTLKATEVALRGKPNKAGTFFFESLGRQERLFISTFANLIDATASATENSRALVKHTAWNLLRKVCGFSRSVSMLFGLRTLKCADHLVRRL